MFRGGKGNAPPAAQQPPPQPANVGAPEYFLCPLTGSVMDSPVLSKCGHMFDQSAIVQYLSNPANYGACPVCQSYIEVNSLTACIPLKAAIAEFRKAEVSHHDNCSNMYHQERSGPKTAAGGISKKIWGNSGENLPANVPPPGMEQGSRRPPSGVSHGPPALAPSGLRNNSAPRRGQQPWARLTPLLHTFDPLDLVNEEFSIGRNPICDQVFNYSELSSVHCTVYRVPRPGGDGFDFFLEDKSTNGTFVNGVRVGKGVVTGLNHRDEISLGERFSSKLAPRIQSFVDWVFSGTPLNPTMAADLDQVKQSITFFELIALDEAGIYALGVQSEHVCNKLASAVRNWLEKYRFPAYSFEILGQRTERHRNEPVRPKTDDRKPAGILNRVRPPPAQQANLSNAVAERPVSNVVEFSEVNFSPASYVESAEVGMVALRIRRLNTARGQVQILVRTTDQGTAQENVHYIPMDKRINLVDGITESLVNFHWKPEAMGRGSFTVAFELSILQGKGMPGECAAAVLTIDNTREVAPRASRRESAGNVPGNRPLSSSIPPAVAPMSPSVDGENSWNLDSALANRASPLKSSPSPLAAPPLVQNSSQVVEPFTQMATEKTPEDKHVVRNRRKESFLKTMVDAFPTMNPNAIEKIVEEQSKALIQVEDFAVVEEIIVLKLSTLSASDKTSAPTIENVAVHQLTQKQKNDLEKTADVYSGPSDAVMTLKRNMGNSSAAPIQTISFPIAEKEEEKPAQKEPPNATPVSESKISESAPKKDEQNMDTKSTLAAGTSEVLSTPATVEPVKARDSPTPTPVPAAQSQTILRKEIPGFLMMASVSLIRKFFSMQGCESNIAHCTSPVLAVAADLAKSFATTTKSLLPLTKAKVEDDDVFDFEKLVDQFKQYVFEHGNELRGKAKMPLQKDTANGFRYMVANHKSDHHVRMENNHAVIEDLSQFAGISSVAPTTSFFAVYDGHGGYLISEYLSLHLAFNIAKQPSFSSNLEDAIKSGFAYTDEMALKRIQRDGIRGGSTAVTTIIRDNIAHIAWVGDARALIFKRVNGALVAHALAIPHNAYGAEKERVQKAGGFVEFIAGKWRVNGRLAVTRSFGDESLKPVVIAVPEIVQYPLQADDEILMLSCDGIFDVMESNDVAQHLDECLKRDVPVSELAEELVNETVQRGGADDITVLMVHLKKA